MWNSNTMNISDLTACQPWWLIRCNSCINHFWLVSCNCIKCQSWRIISHWNNLSIWNKTKLNKCLESITDTHHQAITIFQKIMNSICQTRISQEWYNKLTTSVWLVTTAKSTRKHYDLRIVDLLFHNLNRIFNHLCI